MTREAVRVPLLNVAGKSWLRLGRVLNIPSMHVAECSTFSLAQKGNVLYQI